MTTALFLGGWQVPYLQAAGFVFPWGGAVALPHLVVVGSRSGAFLTKVVVMIWFLMLIRWTLPALPLRSGDAARLARPVPAVGPQHRGDRPRAAGGGEA